MCGGRIGARPDHKTLAPGARIVSLRIRVNDDGQQTLLGLFTPAAGVHRVPPATEVRTQRPDIRAPSAVGEVVFERSHRARNYRLTLRRDGTAVATIPAHGSERQALRFVEEHREWLDRARERQRKRPRAAEVWAVGTRVLWRGELTEDQS